MFCPSVEPPLMPPFQSSHRCDREGQWAHVLGSLDRTIFLDVPKHVCRQRVVERKVRDIYAHNTDRSLENLRSNPTNRCATTEPSRTQRPISTESMGRYLTGKARPMPVCCFDPPTWSTLLPPVCIIRLRVEKLRADIVLEFGAAKDSPSVHIPDSVTLRGRTLPFSCFRVRAFQCIL